MSETLPHDYLSAETTISHRLLAPRVGFLIGSGKSLPGQTIAPMSNLTQVSNDPEIFALAAGTQSQTLANIRKTGGFAVSVPTVAQQDLVWKLADKFSGYQFAPGHTKIDEFRSDLDLESSPFGPILRESIGWCSCEVMFEVPIPEGDHGLFIAKVTEAWFNPTYMNQDGTYKFNPKPLMQVVKNSFATSTDHWEIPWIGEVRWK